MSETDSKYEPRSSGCLTILFIFVGCHLLDILCRLDRLEMATGIDRRIPFKSNDKSQQP